MALLNFSTKCPCGADLKAKVRKPTWFDSSFTKLHCTDCDSRFFVSMVRDKTNRLERVFATHMEILELSPKAESKLRSSPIVKGKIALEKVANAVGIEQKPDNSVIETEMDG